MNGIGGCKSIKTTQNILASYGGRAGACPGAVKATDLDLDLDEEDRRDDTDFPCLEMGLEGR